MDREIFEGITTGNLIYFAAVSLTGLVLALVVRLITGRIKGGLRERGATSLAARMVDDADGALSLLIFVTGLYLGLIGLPPVGDLQFAVRQSYIVLSIGMVVYAGIRMQGDALTWYGERLGYGTNQARMVNSLIPLAKRLAGMATLTMGVLVVLDQVGISIAPLVAGLGISGLAVALALQGTLTNLFAGLNVMTDGSVRAGDFVELDGGISGYVDQVGWRTTRIRLLSNNMVIIPNSKLADNVATNYNYPVEEMSAYVQVGVSYFSNLEHVERVTVEVARTVMEETPGAVPGYAPSIWYTEFGDSNINFWVVLRARRYVDSWLLKHNFIKALFHRYNQEGIEISFPARSVFMRDANESPQPDGPSQSETTG